MKFKLTVTFFKIIRLYSIEISEKWDNLRMLSESGIEIFEFISEVSLINSETESIEVYSVLNTSSVISLMEIICLNKNKIS